MEPFKSTRIASLALFGLALICPINLSDQESALGFELWLASLILWDTPIIVLGCANLLTPYLLIHGLFAYAPKILLGFGCGGALLAGLYGLAETLSKPIFGANLFWTLAHLSAMILFALSFLEHKRGLDASNC